MVASQEWVGKINSLPYLFSLTLISCQSIPLAKHNWKLEEKGVHQCTLYKVRPLEHRAEQWENLRSKWKISQDISCHVYSAFVCVCVLVAQLCLILCNPMDCSPPGSSVHGILQARILEWVAMPSTRGSFRPRNLTWVSCIAGGLYHLSHQGSTRKFFWENLRIIFVICKR